MTTPTLQDHFNKGHPDLDQIISDHVVTIANLPTAEKTEQAIEILTLLHNKGHSDLTPSNVVNKTKRLFSLLNDTEQARQLAETLSTHIKKNYGVRNSPNSLLPTKHRPS